MSELTHSRSFGGERRGEMVKMLFLKLNRTKGGDPVRSLTDIAQSLSPNPHHASFSHFSACAFRPRTDLNYFAELLCFLLFYLSGNSELFQEPKSSFVLVRVEDTAVSGECGSREVLFLILDIKTKTKKYLIRTTESF